MPVRVRSGVAIIETRRIELVTCGAPILFIPVQTHKIGADRSVSRDDILSKEDLVFLRPVGDGAHNRIQAHCFIHDTQRVDHIRDIREVRQVVTADGLNFLI